MTWRSALVEFRKGLPIHRGGEVCKRRVWEWIVLLMCSLILSGAYGVLVYNIMQLEKENTALKARCGEED